MSDNQDITLKILVHDAQGKFRGGTVDVEFKHLTLSEHAKQRGLDASREITIAGLRRAPMGNYQITVIPTDVFEPESQFVNIPASGFATMTVVIGRAQSQEPKPDPNFTVKGTVRTAAGALAINVPVRAVHQTASTLVRLGEGKTDSQGNFVIKYSSELVTGEINLRVQAFDENGNLLGESDQITPVKREEVVNLILPDAQVTQYRVEGQVSRPDKTLVVDAKVQAFDVSTDRERLLGQTITDGFGRFKITYPGTPFEARGSVDLIVRAFDSQSRLLAASAVIRKAKPIEQVRLVIDDAPPADKSFVVRGTVSDANGKPVAAITVRAFDRDLRSEELLGQTTTGARGAYEIRYSAEQFRRAEKVTADLRVAAYNVEGQELVSSALIFNARPEETVDLAIGPEKDKGLSEYERYLTQVAPVLESISLADLSQDDIVFLTGETRIDQEHLLFLVTAAQFSANTKSDSTNLPPEVFYAFFRHNLPVNLPALLAQSPDALRGALEASLRNKIVPAALENQIPAILKGLQLLVVKRAFHESGQPGQASLGALLGTAIGERELQEKFLTLYADHQGPIENFWQQLHLNPEFQRAGVVEDLQFAIQAGALTQNYPPLVHKLQQMRREGASLKDLVRLDVSAWKELITSSSDGQQLNLPPSIQGTDNAERTTNYANLLVRMLEDSFPTAAIAHRVAQDNAPADGALVRFLSSSPDFDFSKTHIDSYLRQSSAGAPVEEEKRSELAKQLKGMQRVFRLTPRYDEMRPLLADGFDSAQSISRASRRNFLARYSEQIGGRARAEAIYDRSQRTTAIAVNVFGRCSWLFNSVNLNVTPSAPADIEGIPDWRTLFGPIDFCDCEDCRSVYSPAAYLVDILAFLKNCPATTAGRTAKDILFERRGDVGEIELSCENTNTPLPYVDLVNEVLENAVAPPPPGTPIPQTHGTPSQLSANAEHVNPEAYNALAAAVYPWSLPLNRWIEEERSYLDHLGSSRRQVMDAFQHNNDPSDLLIAYEVLRLTPEQGRIVTGTAGRQPWEFWGHTTDPGDGWLTQLSRVSVFLEKSGLSYEQLLELLDTAFVNPDKNDAALRIHLHTDGTPCDLSQLRIERLDAGVLDRIHRFVRLQQALGWKSKELDKAIQTLTPSTTDPHRLVIGVDLIVKLADVKRLQDELGLPLDQLFSLWANIDSDGEDALYQRLFRNKTVLNPLDTAFELSRPPAGPEVVGVPGSELLISKHAPAILAALSISAADLALLTAPGGAVADDRLNLGNLSMLYRHAVLARALHWSIGDLLSLKALTAGSPNVNPFAPGDPSSTRRFIDKTRKVQRSGFSAAQLNYLYRHISEAPGAVAPPLESVSLLMQTLRGGLKKILEETALIADPTGELTQQQWQTRLPDDQVRTAMSIIEGTSALAEAAQNDFIDARLAQFINAPEAKRNLVGPARLRERPARFAYVFQSLMRRSLSDSLIKQTLADSLKLDSAMLALLVGSLIKAQSDTDKPALADFRRLTDDGPVPAFCLKSYELLNKVALLVNKFKITVKELTYISSPGSDFASFDLNQLPLSSSVSAARATTLFAQWERMYALFTLRDSFLLPEIDLIEVFAAASLAEARQKLNQATGWKSGEVEELTGATGFNFTLADFKSESQLIRLQNCLALATRLGVSTSQLFGWARNRPDEPQAQSVKNAVKAKYDDEQWMKVAKPLKDLLREKQRAALVSYLLAKLNLRHPNDLFARFLIDVEMSPCQMTTRIKQAIGSVQLFVQRCLMNQEPRVAIEPDLARQWKWMKNYRVWEANRKIFLFPENWIEPELRDNKSPFFKELENQLLQNEITPETAEDAFVSYLEKLDQVARLEICGIYHEKETIANNPAKTAVDNLHVFGRTSGIPPLYYYRRYVDSSYWTPWEKVDVDIEGDHLVPVIYNRRLRLCWPIFTEKAETNLPEANQRGQEPPKYWEIKIAWSEYKSGKWVPKKVEKGHLDSRNFPTGRYSPRSEYAFRAILDDALTVRCLYGGLPLGDFRFVGCTGSALLIYDPTPWVPALVPSNSHRENLMFVEGPPNGPSNDALYLFEGEVPLVDIKPSEFVAASWVTAFILLGAAAARIDIPTLRRTPGTFGLLYPHQDDQFNVRRPFVYQDDTRTFVVFPEVRRVNLSEMMFNPALARLETIDVAGLYANSVSINQPIGQILQPSDPPAFELSVPVFAGGVIPSLGKTGGVGPGKPSVAPAAGQISGGGKQSSSMTFPAYNPRKRFVFQTFYHPYACLFTRELNRYGIDGLLQRPIQIEPQTFYQPQARPEYFEADYGPHDVVARPYPNDDVDFSFAGAYSLYNWELFFHAPLLVADRLSKNQRFEEAQKWFHFIFDPTDRSERSIPAPNRYWRTRPFFESDDRRTIQDLMLLLSAGDSPEKRDLIKQVEQWRKSPFNPHLIGRFRLTAYQKTVVMKYLDNLIAWGDQLFRRDTIETINEATQLYILAANILGPRPAKLPARKAEDRTFNQLENDLDAFSNAVVGVENALASIDAADAPSSTGDAPAFSLPPTLYFCIPKNDKLLGYWDTVADRLFKIRHCMNIEGLTRQLPLFEPPIDPALLVRAAAAGIDLSSALNDINAALPHYRFSYLLQRAIELCSDLKAIGGAFVSALEKRDAEALALLRSTHEIELLSLVRQIKLRQIEEAKETLRGLEKSKEVIDARYTYYRDIEKISSHEKGNQDNLHLANIFQTIGQGIELGAIIAHAIPNLDMGASGWAGSPVVKLRVGGTNVGNALQAMSKVSTFIASIYSANATMNSIQGGHERRWAEWKLQEKLAGKELEQVEKQILAAHIRKEIAENDLRNHDRQIENAKAVDEYMRNKFTNQALYDWMVSQISTIYFQSYQMAFDIAKRAERAFRFERGLTASSYIQFGNWDSLKKGLLSGERLHYDLKRLEMAYLDQNKRELEITKNISLELTDPLALLTLRETGRCEFELPEQLFDFDYPGHYMRRIKSVSLTIPCVTGPYTSINCTLTLLSNRTRIKNSLRSSSSNPYPMGEDDDRFVTNFSSLQSISTSQAQNDSGLFELNFRDERYLPFEGAGAISRWRIEMPRECNRFDFNTLSDVVLQLKYTARDGGETLKGEAKRAVVDATPRAGVRLFSARHEFPTEWHRFLNPEVTATEQRLELTLTRDHFPFMAYGTSVTVSRLELFLLIKNRLIYEGDAPPYDQSAPGIPNSPLKVSVTPPDAAASGSTVLRRDSVYGGVPHATIPLETLPPSHLLVVANDRPVNLLIEALGADIAAITTELKRQIPTTSGAPRTRLKAEAIEDLVVVCHYRV